MARTKFVVGAELSLAEERLAEWIKPLSNSLTSNRFTEFTSNSDLFNAIIDTAQWVNSENVKLGNCNNFCIFELGEDSGFNVIRNSYEIGNESFISTEINSSGDSESVINPTFYELSLIKENGIEKTTYTDATHLTPYYPDNVLKYSTYCNIDFVNNTCDSYKDTALPNFSSTDIFNDNNIISISANKNDIGSSIPNIIPTDLGTESRVNDFVNPVGYDVSIRKEIYIAYCASKNWWKDDDGEIASWYKKDQGDYNGRYKICSSWQIYEWLLEEIRQLNIELDYLNSRTQEQIEDGLSIGQLINGAGLDYMFYQMFNEYPGVYTSVLIQFGYYEYTGDPSLNEGTKLFQSYGYREITDISDSFANVATHYSVFLDKIKTYFEPWKSIELSDTTTGSDGADTTVTGTITIYRLKRDKFMTANNKYQYFISVYFLGLLVDYESPCEYDQVIMFIVLVIITIYTLGSGTPYAAGTFAAYAAEFAMWTSLIVMWASFLGYGDSKFIKALAIVTALFGNIDTSSWISLALTASLRGIQLALAIDNMQHKKESDEQFKETEVREEKLRKVQSRLRSEHKNDIRFMPFDTMMQKADMRYNGHAYLTILNNDYKEKYGE